MKIKETAFVLLFALLDLVACSSFDGEEDVLARYDENGYKYSPTELYGSLEYMPSMTPESIRIVKLDYSLNPIDSFEVELDSGDFASKRFSVASRDYESPIVKIVTFFPLGEKSKMEFPQYYHLHEYNSNITLNIYGAIISGRVETLVRNENYSLEKAKTKAYDELAKALGMSTDNLEQLGFYEYYYDGWNRERGLFDLLPFVLCQHEISDSAFYREFNELRKDFAEKGTISSSIKVRSADAWLSTFSLNPDEKLGILYKSENRDTSRNLKRLDTAFFEWAYDLDSAWIRSKITTIDNESSKFNGRTFVYEDRHYGGWRLREPIEDTIGTCEYSYAKFVEHEGLPYLCKQESFLWELQDNADTILSYKYGHCDGRSVWAYGKVGTVNNQMYVCSCDNSDKCEWSKVQSDFKPAILDTPSVNVLATLRYGECKNNNGEKHEMDSLLVRCHSGKWLKVDSLSYEMGVCNNTSNIEEFGQMPNGDYYWCKSYGSKKWIPCTYADVKGDLCNWVTVGIYKKYDKQYFYCEKERWREVPEDSVYKPVVEDIPCSRDNVDEIKKYDDESFICSRIVTSGKELYYWLAAKD